MFTTIFSGLVLSLGLLGTGLDFDANPVQCCTNQIGCCTTCQACCPACCAPGMPCCGEDARCCLATQAPAAQK